MSEEIDIHKFTVKELIRDNYREINGINKRLDTMNGTIRTHDKSIEKICNKINSGEAHAERPYKIIGVVVCVLVFMGAISDILSIF